MFCVIIGLRQDRHFSFHANMSLIDLECKKEAKKFEPIPHRFGKAATLLSHQ